MKRRKLTVQFEKNNITIKEKGNVSMGVPYRFDTQYGKDNMKQFLGRLGFNVEIIK